MEVVTPLSFQVQQTVVRAANTSGVFIDIIKILYQPAPEDLGSKSRYRISFSLSENGISVWNAEGVFENILDAIQYSLSSEVIEKAKQLLIPQI